MRADSRRIGLGTGVELNYVDRGTGRPVVFVPGWMASVEFFRHQLPHVAENYRAISYDPRGQGDSSRPATGNNFTQRAKDLHAFLTALGLEDVVLVGWSYGSYDAYAYLRDFGIDKVAGVVVIDQPPRSWATADDTESWSESALRPDALLYFQRAAIGDRRGFWAYMVKLMLDRDPEGAEDPEVQWMIDTAMRMPGEAAALMLMDGTTSDFSAVAEEVSNQVPTLVNGNASVADTARAWVGEHMPKAEFARTPTHMGFYIDPETFNDRLDRFLSSLR